MPYTIEEHKHRFSAWAAGRAANVKGCRFSVAQAKIVLENSGLIQLILNPENLPLPKDIDTYHREWREAVIASASTQGLNFTHGVAAKLINIYLKSAFVCGGHHENERVMALHPPIDSLLLEELFENDIGGLGQTWHQAQQIRWSNFNSEQYELVIISIRNALNNEEMWKIEQYWRGFQ